jgi:hypothetical protein
MIIAFTGQPGAGKSTAAKILQALYPNMGFRILSFADPVYDILDIVHTGQWDFTWEKAQKKSALPDMYGNDTRTLLRLIGEFGRREINPSVWVDLAMKRITASGNFIFDDLRFPNELMALQDRRAKVFEVIRPGNPKSEHFSDNALENYNFEKLINTNYADLQMQLKTSLSFF